MRSYYITHVRIHIYTHTYMCAGSKLDLDLTYICDRLIAMAMPCVEGAIYRNDIREVSRFFATRHYGTCVLYVHTFVNAGVHISRVSKMLCHNQYGACFHSSTHPHMHACACMHVHACIHTKVTRAHMKLISILFLPWGIMVHVCTTFMHVHAPHSCMHAIHKKKHPSICCCMLVCIHTYMEHDKELSCVDSI